MKENKKGMGDDFVKSRWRVSPEGNIV